MLLNDAVLEIMLPFESKAFVVVDVMLSGIENTKDVSLVDPTHTKPACRVREGVFELVVTSKETVAEQQFLILVHIRCFEQVKQRFHEELPSLRTTH